MGFKASPFSRGVSFAFGALCVCLVLVSPCAQAQQPIVYQWDPVGWLASYPTTQFTGTAITNPDGTTGAQITVTARDTTNPYNNIFVHNAGLVGGHQYTAVVTFSIAAQTTYPSSFYIYARNSLGNQYDIRQTWSGLPGTTRKTVLPLNLPNLSGGTWNLYLGIGYGGSINLNSVIVYSGLTSDGQQAYTQDPPTLNATPSNTLPSGFVTATGYTAFTPAAPATPVTIVSLVGDANFVADVAGAPNSVAVANAAELQAKINTLPTNHPCELLLPAGTYRLAPTTTSGSATYNGFTFANLTDLTVNGQGATLVCENLAPGGEMFNLGTLTRAIFENINLDWDWNTSPIANLAVVSNITAGGAQCDMTFNTGTSTAFTTAQMTAIQTAPWTALFQMDPTHLVCNQNYFFSIPSGTTVTAGSAANVLHVTFPSAAAAPTLVSGASYCIRHYYYNMSAFKVADCTDLVFSALNIYSMPGMGFFFEGRMHDLELTGCNIVRPTSTSYTNNYPAAYTLTTAADGLHSDETMGNVRVENCGITGCGDDAINIHDDCYQDNVTTSGTNAISLVNCYSYNLRFKVGDLVGFYNADYSYLGTATSPVTLPVASVTTHDSSSPPHVDITFGSALPAGLTSQSIIRNATFDTSNIRLASDTIQYTNGRGILLSADNATLSNNFMRGIFGIPIYLETDITQMLWAEGHGSSNMVISNNTILDSNLQGRYGGAFIYANPNLPYGQVETTLYSALSITGNVFYDAPGPVVSLNNCANVLFNNNQMRFAVSPANINIYAGTVMVTNGYNLALGGNKWINIIPSTSTYGVIYDKATTQYVNPDLNSLTNSY